MPTGVQEHKLANNLYGLLDKVLFQCASKYKNRKSYSDKLVFAVH